MAAFLSIWAFFPRILSDPGCDFFLFFFFFLAYEAVFLG